MNANDIKKSAIGVVYNIMSSTLMYSTRMYHYKTLSTNLGT